MFARILLILLITPIVELALLLQVGQWIGFWPTIGLIVVTALAGSVLLKQQGLSVWRQLQQRLGMGDLPGTQIVDGVIVLMSGALLVTPGVLTDVAGFAGLIPLTRAPIRRLIMKRFQRSVAQGSMQMRFGSFGSAVFDPPQADDDGADWKGEAATKPRGTTRPPGPGEQDPGRLE